MNFFTYWNADKLVLSMNRRPRGRRAHRAGVLRASSATSPRKAGLPMPRVYVADNPQPNAFATGRNPENAAVCATTGLLADRCRRDEIAGVMAHELAHVKNRDTLTMTDHRDHRRRDLDARQLRLLLRRQPRQQQSARLRRRPGRRHRRAARRACWCRWRSAARANIPPTAPAPRSAAGRARSPRRSPRSRNAARRIPNEAAERNPATAHLFIVNPLSGARMDNLFSTHPATENRIAALMAMEGEFGGARAAPRRVASCRASAAPDRPAPRGPWG